MLWVRDQVLPVTALQISLSTYLRALFKLAWRLSSTPIDEDLDLTLSWKEDNMRLDSFHVNYHLRPIKVKT